MTFNLLVVFVLVLSFLVLFGEPYFYFFLFHVGNGTLDNAAFGGVCESVVG